MHLAGNPGIHVQFTSTLIVLGSSVTRISQWPLFSFRNASRFNNRVEINMLVMEDKLEIGGEICLTCTFYPPRPTPPTPLQQSYLLFHYIEVISHLVLNVQWRVGRLSYSFVTFVFDKF